MAIIVGDIHGNVEKVKTFLAYKPEEEHVCLGDYVDSYYEPQGRQILALRLLLDSKAILLWGNHDDLHYLKTPPWLCTGFQHGREKPLQEIIESNKCDRFLAAYGLQDSLSTLHLSCSPENIPTPPQAQDSIRVGANPYPTGTFTLQDTPSFA